MITSLSLEWEKSAFLKLAGLGAIVFLPTKGGKYLMQVADRGDETPKGKLRPPGGGKNPSDKSLHQTMVRELQEEFALSKKEIEKNLTFLGYEYRDKFWGNAVYELQNHGLHPGEYQASNSPDEIVELVESTLSDPKYVGPDPELLLTESEKRDAEDTMAESKAAMVWDLFKEAADENLHDLFKPDFSPAQLQEKNVYTRLYHKLLPRLASQESWPKEWTTDADPRGWLEWYEQYHGGRRSPDDARQIRRWLNFKSRHGGPYKKNPSPRRGWALTNWAIDPATLLPAGARSDARKAMDDYQQKIDRRYRGDENRKQAASVGLERPMGSHRFITHDELHGIADGRVDPKTLGPMDVVSPDGERESLEDYINKLSGETGRPTIHLPGCENKAEKVAPKLPEKELSKGVEEEKEHTSNEAMSRATAVDHLKEDPAYYSHLDEMKEKHGSKTEQGVMGGNSVDASVPIMHVPPMTEQTDLYDKLNGFSFGPSSNTDRSQRLIALRKRRGELPDGSLDPAVLAEASNPFPEKSAMHERVIAWAKDEPCPECGEAENMETSIVDADSGPMIRCGGCGHKSKAEDWHNKQADAQGPTSVVYDHQHAQDAMNSKVPQKKVLSGPVDTKTPVTYFSSSAMTAKPASMGDGGPALDIPPSTTTAAGVKGQIVGLSPVNGIGPEPGLHVGNIWDLQKTAMAIDAAGIPTTGPEAIYHALQNLDLGKKEAEAKSVIQRKLKSKRPDAVKILGYLEGMKRSGIQPHELMITRVPVIPPQFRPYSVAGDTFVPGDANELYRDLINITNVHRDIESNLGKIGSGFSRLNVYDAVRATYGFGEPTSPKTRERGVSGFLKKVTGFGPKFSYPQARMLAKDQDYVGRSVIGVDPDLGLDEIGIPDEMAWKLYSPYVQRRLVRNGVAPEQAVKFIADRHELASKMLDAEMKDRPVVYGRQPSWHKFNVIGGWPKRIDGNMIRINALVTTGLNADFDGDTLNVHLPSMPEAVSDAKEKLMPSRMLFSIKDRTKVVPTPKQEFVLGLYQAQRRPARRSHVFPTEKTALAAIRSGQVDLSDDVQIGAIPKSIAPIAAPSTPEIENAPVPAGELAAWGGM